MRFPKPRTPLSALLLLAMGFCVHAREPSINSNTQPGSSLGTPIAVNPPPGWYLTNRSAYFSYTLRDDKGGYLGRDAKVAADALQWTWISGALLWGASYKVYVQLPMVNIDLTQTAPATGQRVASHVAGWANPKIQPLDLSWNLGQGWYAIGTLGFYAPWVYYEQKNPLKTSANFWTIEPAAGITYLRDGWLFAAHVIYDTNTRNPDNDYRSGDQAFFNLTLNRAFGNWMLGPVAYYHQQVTPDSNGRGATIYGGQVAPEQRQIGGGLSASTKLGPAKLDVIVARDVQARNTFAGDKVWINLTLPF